MIMNPEVLPLEDIRYLVRVCRMMRQNATREGNHGDEIYAEQKLNAARKAYAKTRAAQQAGDLCTV